MSKRVTSAVIAVVALASVASACSDDEPPVAPRVNPIVTLSPIPSSLIANLPKCDPVPHAAVPDWIPKDLPLPAGWYVSRDLGTVVGVRGVELYLPGTLEQLARIIVYEWPKANYVLGESDAEAQELDQLFWKGTTNYSLKARFTECKPVHTVGVLRMQVVSP